MNRFFSLDIPPNLIKQKSSFYLAYYDDKHPEYNYDILIPIFCKQTPLNPGSPIFRSKFVPIANFESDNTSIVISLCHLPKTMQTLGYITLDNMYGTKVKLLDGTQKSNFEAEILVELIEKNEKWICRSRLIKNRKNLFRIDISLTERVYLELINILLISMKSFKLKNPRDTNNT